MDKPCTSADTQLFVPQFKQRRPFSCGLNPSESSLGQSVTLKNGILFLYFAQICLFQTALPSATTETLKDYFSTTNTQEAGIDLEARRPLSMTSNTLLLGGLFRWINDGSNICPLSEIFTAKWDYSLAQSQNCRYPRKWQT